MTGLSLFLIECGDYGFDPRNETHAFGSMRNEAESRFFIWDEFRMAMTQSERLYDIKDLRVICALV